MSSAGRMGRGGRSECVAWWVEFVRLLHVAEVLDLNVRVLYGFAAYQAVGTA